MPESIPPEARVGELIDDRFRIVAHLATGGMASVYRAEHVHNRQVYAVKVLDREYSKHPEASARFQREVQAYRRIRHPHVVAAIDFGRLDDGCLYMVLEFIQGVDLRELLERTSRLDTARAAKIAYQVSLALVAAHAIGVVHRDLKPENIMLVSREGDTDYVKVVDFGIAKIPTTGQALTALGSVFGTPDYMAPEQARGGQVDARTDLYAVGAVLYEMIMGTPPFDSPNIGELIMAQITKEPPPLPASVDPELNAVVMQLLAKDPAKRLQSANELSERLRQIVARLAPHLLAARAPLPSAGDSSDRRPLPPRAPPPTPPPLTPPPATSGPQTPGPALRQPASLPVPQPAVPQAAPRPPAEAALSPSPLRALRPSAAHTQPVRKSSWIALTILLGIVALLGWLVARLL